MILTIVLKRMSVDTAENTEIWTSMIRLPVCTRALALSQASRKHIAIECFLPLALSQSLMETLLVNGCFSVTADSLQLSRGSGSAPLRISPVFAATTGVPEGLLCIRLCCLRHPNFLKDLMRAK